MRRASLLMVCAATAVLPLSAAHAADAKSAQAKKTVDANDASIEFLEYLGSLEGDEDNWTDFETLSKATVDGGRTQRDKAGKTSKTGPAQPAAEAGK